MSSGKGIDVLTQTFICRHASCSLWRRFMSCWLSVMHSRLSFSSFFLGHAVPSHFATTSFIVYHDSAEQSNCLNPPLDWLSKARVGHVSDGNTQISVTT